MWKYEYRRAWVDDDELEATCNEGGQKGWHLKFQRWDAERAEWDCFFERIRSNRDILKESFSLSPR